MSLIIPVGRGHSGTRAISQTLYASGVFMGNTINSSGDKVPPETMYEACRIFARQVRWLGGLSWDFDAVVTGAIDPLFKALVEIYLADVLADTSPHKGWKLPETVLALPWIVRLFPDARYIYWIRDPRDAMLKRHLTDDLARLGVQYPRTDDELLRRAISWKYQDDLMRATPRPRNCAIIRFEDFVLRQEEALQDLEQFLGLHLARIVVRPESVGRWRTADRATMYDFFRPSMKANGYLED